MIETIIDFFNSEKIKNETVINIEQLLFNLAEQKIATNSSDAYYFIRICRGMGVLMPTKPKTFNINRDVLNDELKRLENAKQKMA